MLRGKAATSLLCISFLLLPRVLLGCERIALSTDKDDGSIGGIYGLYAASFDRPAYRRLSIHHGIKKTLFLYFMQKSFEGCWQIGHKFGGGQPTSIAYASSWALSPLMIISNWTYSNSSAAHPFKLDVQCLARPLSLHVDSRIFPALSGFYVPASVEKKNGALEFRRPGIYGSLEGIPNIAAEALSLSLQRDMGNDRWEIKAGTSRELIAYIETKNNLLVTGPRTEVASIQTDLKLALERKISPSVRNSPLPPLYDDDSCTIESDPKSTWQIKRYYLPHVDDNKKSSAAQFIADNSLRVRRIFEIDTEADSPDSAARSMRKDGP